MEELDYVSIVGEIFDGYSEFDYNGTPVFIKHSSIRDQRHINVFRRKYRMLAISRGVPTEEEMLQRLREDDLWTDVDDRKIVELEDEIHTLNNTKRNLILPSQKRELDGKILDLSRELSSLLIKKQDIVGTTADDYASNRANQEFLRFAIYKDRSLSSHFFTDAEFSELPSEDVAGFLKETTSMHSRMCEENIKHAVLQDFFNMYSSYTENPSQFYGKPVIDLTAFQLKLAIYSTVFSNILQRFDDIPDSIKQDPNALLMFSENKSNSANSGYEKRDGGTMVFGATKEDLKALDPNAKSVSLSDLIAENGGALDMNKMMELMG